jgi:uncharacterized protein (TIGR02099 family)
MTKTAKHSLLFRVWIHLRGLLAFVIVAFGVIVGLVTLILPNEDLYKPYVVDFLSHQLDKKVEIESISGQWKGFGPNFIINGLVVKDDDEVVVQQATLNINVIQYIIPKGSTGITLGVNDIEVDFERKLSGKIVVADPVISKESFSDKIDKLLGSGTLSINNLTLNLHDSVENKNNQINTKIMVQQSSGKRAFAMILDAKEIAQNIEVKAITEKNFNFMQQARWYMEIGDLVLDKLSPLINIKYLPNILIDGQVWFSTENGNIVELMAQAELKDEFFKLNAEKFDMTGTAELVYKGSNQDWQAQLKLYDVKTESISQDEITINLTRKDSFIYLKADELNIPLLKAITQVVDISNDDFDAMNLNGRLTNVDIKYDIDLRRIVEGNVFFHELDLLTKSNSFTNVSGEVNMFNEQIRLMIDSDKGTADFPGFIRGQVAWEKLLLTAQTSMHDENLDVKINSLWCDCQDFMIDGSARAIYEESLWLDLTFAVYRAKVNQLYKYWPQVVWKPNLLKYLDEALISGVVEKGYIIYHGFTDQKPFVGNQGVFLTKSYLVDANINYQNDWPAVEHLDAIVESRNRLITVKSMFGKVLDAQIDNVTAVIGNLKKPLLKVDIEAHGEDNFLIDVLNRSPMNKALNVLKEDISFTGPQTIKVNLNIPLNKPGVKVEPTGSINFKNSDFQMGQFQLTELNGDLDFKGSSLDIENLNAKFLNKEVLVTGKIINEINQPAQLDVVLKGEYDMAHFESVLGFTIPAKGQSPWMFSISNKNTKDILFKAESNLQGVEITMPEPLSKSLTQPSNFSIACILPCVDSGWDLNFDDSLKTSFNRDIETGELKLNSILFGDQNSIVDEAFGGQIDVVDVDKWIELLSKNKQEKSTKSLPFKQMSLHINKLIFMSRELENVSLDIKNDDEGMIFSIDGDDIVGEITLPNDIENKGIIVQLDKLHWKEVENIITIQKSSSVSSSYPALHVWIGDFIYDGIPLGESSIEVRSVAQGIRIEKFNTRSELMNLTINGIWLKDQGDKGLSKFNIIMTSKNIVQFLTTLGFEAPISKAEIIIDMQAQWQDFPSQFEIKNINGNMHIEVGEGEVIDAKPGMGRVLGLFSLTNLPRRLILDFRDVLGKGLRFKSMIGDFTLINGEANTDSFVIDTSSAEIVISGRTGLSNQDYDQSVIVIPRVGRVLPTIGAIAGGAVGAAAGFLVQGMFRKGLKDVGKIIYKVTGSWDNPIIELIETQNNKKTENEK